MAEMLVVTTERVPGQRVARVIGEVFGITTVRSRGLGGANLTSLQDARLRAIDGLREAAAEQGGNAVVMMRFDSSAIGQSMSEVVAYGTAVVLEPDAPS